MNTLRLNQVRVSAAMSLGMLLLVGCAQIAPAQKLTCAEKMMWSTYALATPKGMATCVVVNRKDPSAANGIVPVVVTSAHVLSVAPFGPFYLIIRERREGGSPSVSVLEFQGPSPTDRPFFQHPRYDVAALELRIPPEFASYVSIPSFIKESDIAASENEPHAGDEVSVLGFPRVFPGTEGAFPVLRGGKIASYSAGTAADHEKFLVNSSVYSGDSGGPVFTGRRGGNPKLVGLVTERIGEKDTGIPLAIALNASVVRETLQLQARQERWYLGEETSKPMLPPKDARRGVQLVGPPGKWVRPPAGVSRRTFRFTRTQTRISVKPAD